jgi:threonine dehydrogenase-like Zn-dependent dehydrogenase
MRALVFDGSLRIVRDLPAPVPAPGESLVRVLVAGLCSTDLEITRGYAAFRGILGHEFVGVIEQSPDRTRVGQRVVGEINASCGQCAYCRAGLPTHCQQRTVLGIHTRPGAFADFLSLPEHNLHCVPPSVSDEEAVFTEPLAAAVQVAEQVHIHPSDRVVVVGDGKLGVLVAQALRLIGCDLVVVGKHADKLERLAALGIVVRLVAEAGSERADVVVECSGQPAGLELARTLARPRGVIVLKSTFHGAQQLALSPYVVDEVTIVGSRCGPFAPALRLLESKLVHVTPFISATYELSDGVDAMTRAAEPGVMKVLLKP